MTGRVIRSRGRFFTVLADGEEYQCEVLGKAKRETGHSPVAIGDLVDFSPSADGSGGIEFVHPRKTKFSRPRVGEETKGTEQIIVANVDQMVIVVSVRQPELKLRLIDRFMVAAQKGGLEGKVGGSFGSSTHSGEAPKLIFDTMKLHPVVRKAVTSSGLGFGTTTVFPWRRFGWRIAVKQQSHG